MTFHVFEHNRLWLKYVFCITFFFKHKELLSCVFIVLYEGENEQKKLFYRTDFFIDAFVFVGFEGFLERTTVYSLALRLIAIAAVRPRS